MNFYVQSHNRLHDLREKPQEELGPSRGSFRDETSSYLWLSSSTRFLCFASLQPLRGPLSHSAARSLTPGVASLSDLTFCDYDQRLGA